MFDSIFSLLVEILLSHKQVNVRAFYRVILCSGTPVNGIHLMTETGWILLVIPNGELRVWCL